MNFMATAKKAVKKATKKVAQAAKKAVEKGSPEWFAQKEEARRKLDARLP